MKRQAALVILLAALAGCSSGNEPPPAPPAPQVSNTRPNAPPRADRSDQCGARELSWLIGRPKADIPVPVDPSNRRVACTACPMTMDYSPRRLNILFDADSGVIKEVKCG